MPRNRHIEKVRAFFKRLLPESLFVATVRAKRAFLREPHEARDLELYRKINRPGTVLAGPFAQMVYIGKACGSALTPKILGTYEMELFPLIEEIIASKPDLVVDVGAAEGYYAVGMARRLPDARVVAFDTDRYVRHVLRQLLQANNVSNRVEVQGECTPQSLESVLASASTPAVICDCEGYEDQLLRPDLASHLKTTIVLVELHEFQSRNVSDRIRDRFSATHRIVTIDSQPRVAKDCKVETPLSEDELTAGLDEHRGTMQWYAMFPLARPA